MNLSDSTRRYASYGNDDVELSFVYQENCYKMPGQEQYNKTIGPCDVGDS